MQDITPWREVELVLTATTVAITHPYTGVDVWVDFVHDSGLCLRRPAFWDGGLIWRVRFASPLSVGTWQWQSMASR